MSIPDGNIKIQILLSPHHVKRLRAWASFHGKAPSAFAAQVLANRIESNLDLIDRLAKEQATDLQLALEDFWALMEREAE